MAGIKYSLFLKRIAISLSLLLSGDAKFASVIYRLFKLPTNVDRSSSQVIYNGTVTESENDLKVGALHTSLSASARRLQFSTWI